MLKTLLAAAAAALITTSLQAATIGFDGARRAGGDVIDTITIDGVDVTFSAIRNTGGGTEAAAPMLFDTTTLTGDDEDLVAPFYRRFVGGVGTRPVDGRFPGNVLIISEDDDSDDPDDNGRGGKIFVSFSQAVNFLGFQVFDDVSDFVVTANDGQSSDPVSLAFDNQFTRVDTDFRNITGLTFDFGSASGAIDNLRFEVVPLPASLPLMIAGLGALGFAARRRRR